MKRFSIILALCLLCIFTSYAQKPKNVRYHIETTADSLLLDMTILQRQRIHQLSADSIRLEKKIAELNNNLAACRKRIKDDSTKIATLNEKVKGQHAQIKTKDDELKRMQSDITEMSNRADSAYLSVAKSYIYTRYVKKDITFAIEKFQQIRNQKIKKEYESLYQLLKMYAKYNEEFLSILEEAQSDEERNSKGIAENAKLFSDKYVEKIKLMEYYKVYFKKYWSIKYLDDKIDEAIALLENNKVALRKVDLSGVIKALKE